MDLYLIRHGESEANRDGIIQGHRDYDLTERGLRQAEALGRLFRVLAPDLDLVATSPLRRARRTAEALARALGLPPPSVHPFLMEIDVGSAQGLSGAGLEAAAPGFLDDLFTHRRGWEAFGGEAHPAFFSRVSRGLEAFLASPAGPRIALVTHGGPLKAIVRHLLGFPDDYILEMRNGTVVKIGLDDRHGRRVATLGFHAHLDLLGLGEATGLRSV